MLSSRLKILAIDDLQDNLTTLNALVREALPNCTLLTALDGSHGIEVACVEDPDVILLDIVMPDMDGFEVCRRMKADNRLAMIPVIFLTALKTDRESRVRALEVGAGAFLSKPIDEMELVAQVRAMAKLKAANRMQATVKEELSSLVYQRTRDLENELAERMRAEGVLRTQQVELERQNKELCRTHAELETSRAKFFDIYDLAPVGYVTVGKSDVGLILESNITASKLFGMVREELVGLPFNRTVLKEDVEKFDLMRTLLVERGEPETCELQMVKKGGAPFWAHLTASLAQDEESGAVCRIVISDISDRKQAEAYREMGREVLQILNEHGDLHDCIQHVLSALKKFTGISAVGIRLQDGEDFPYFVHEGFSEAFLKAENSIIERGANGVKCRTPDGNVCLQCTCGLVISGKTPPDCPIFTSGGSFWTNEAESILAIPASEDLRHHPRNKCIYLGYASIALVPIRTNERIVGLIQLNDNRKGCFTRESIEILEGIAGYIGQALMRKRTEEKLREALAHAQTAAIAKADFLSVMSHELRTPLNGVLGFAELLTYTSLDETQLSYAQTIRNSGNHLLAVVDDILDFSSIEKGHLVLRAMPFAVVGLMEASDLAIRKSATDKGLAFHCEIDPDVPEQVSGDERRIRQILFNLLDNAVKFTCSGSLSLRVTTSSENNRPALDFIVEDTGIGISPETLASLFKPFTQADSTTSRPYGGSGLGLAIAKRLAEAMDGSILVASTPGKGSAFTFRLPTSDSSPQSGGGFVSLSLEPPNGRTSQHAAGATVLLVEDNATSCMLTGKILEFLGYHVEFAINGHEALQAFRKGRFSAILMDMQMPVMDGLVATKKIREVEGVLGGHVPIIALTANVMPGDAERCLAAGMDDFLSKPFNKDALAAKLALFV